MAEVAQMFISVADSDHLYIVNPKDGETPATASNLPHQHQIKAEVIQVAEDVEEAEEVQMEEVEVDQVLDMVCESTPTLSFTFQEGTCFEDMIEFEEALVQFMAETHTVFTIYDSKTSQNANRYLKTKEPLDVARFKYR